MGPGCLSGCPVVRGLNCEWWRLSRLDTRTGENGDSRDGERGDKRKKTRFSQPSEMNPAPRRSMRHERPFRLCEAATVDVRWPHAVMRGTSQMNRTGQRRGDLNGRRPDWTCLMPARSRRRPGLSVRRGLSRRSRRRRRVSRSSSRWDLGIGGCHARLPPDPHEGQISTSPPPRGRDGTARWDEGRRPADDRRSSGRGLRSKIDVLVQASSGPALYTQQLESRRKCEESIVESTESREVDARLPRCRCRQVQALAQVQLPGGLPRAPSG